MIDLSIVQAIDIWEELTTAYYKINSYGGDTAEIYVSRLSIYTATAAHANDCGDIGKEALLLLGRAASRNLKTLISLFISRHPRAQITVDGKAYKEILYKPIYHRVHVRVTEKASK